MVIMMLQYAKEIHPPRTAGGTCMLAAEHLGPLLLCKRVVTSRVDGSAAIAPCSLYQNPGLAQESYEVARDSSKG